MLVRHWFTRVKIRTDSIRVARKHPLLGVRQWVGTGDGSEPGARYCASLFRLYRIANALFNETLSRGQCLFVVGPGLMTRQQFQCLDANAVVIVLDGAFTQELAGGVIGRK